DVALADAARGEALRDPRDALSELAPGQPHRGAALLAKTDQRRRVALLARPAVEVVGEHAVGPDSPLALHRDPARIDLHPLHRPSSRPLVPGPLRPSRAFTCCAPGIAAPGPVSPRARAARRCLRAPSRNPADPVRAPRRCSACIRAAPAPA